MIEPIYILQTNDAPLMADFHPWLEAAAKQAKELGCKHLRASVDDHKNPTKLLVEGWKETTREIMDAGGEGDQRWDVGAKL